VYSICTVHAPYLYGYRDPIYSPGQPYVFQNHAAKHDVVLTDGELVSLAIQVTNYSLTRLRLCCVRCPWGETISARAHSLPRKLTGALIWVND